MGLFCAEALPRWWLIIFVNKIYCAWFRECGDQCSDSSNTCQIQREIDNMLQEYKIVDDKSRSVDWSCSVHQIANVLALHCHAHWLTSREIPVLHADLKWLNVIEELSCKIFFHRIPIESFQDDRILKKLISYILLCPTGCRDIPLEEKIRVWGLIDVSDIRCLERLIVIRYVRIQFGIQNDDGGVGLSRGNGLCLFDHIDGEWWIIGLILCSKIQTSSKTGGVRICITCRDGQAMDDTDTLCFSIRVVDI